MNRDTTTLSPEQTGLLTAHFGASVEVESEDGKRYPCTLRQNLGDLVVGDKIIFQLTQDERGVVIGLHPRQNVLAKPDERGNLKPIASNIDQIIIVVASDPQTPRDLLDSYLVATHALNLDTVVLYNKNDLLTAESKQVADELLSAYRAIDYRAIFSSIKTSNGLDELKECLQNKTSVFVGPSGVGKSSLISTLIPESKITIGQLTAKGFGAHTTTTSRLYHLFDHGQVIDSPGIREFGLWHMEHKDIAKGFIEFHPFQSQCKFRNCMHTHEPHCAVKQAALDGKISNARLQSYYRILKQYPIE